MALQIFFRLAAKKTKAEIFRCLNLILHRSSLWQKRICVSHLHED